MEGDAGTLLAALCNVRDDLNRIVGPNMDPLDIEEVTSYIQTVLDEHIARRAAQG